MTDALLSPLHDRHEALGAKLGDFGGWLMPLEYAGGGVVAEHTAVREHVGVFDVSHLGKVRVAGPGAAAYLDSVLTNALTRIGPGQAQYTLLCAEDGGVIDDLIAYLVSDEWVFLMPNAANAAEVVGVLQAGAPDGVEVVDLHRDFAVLAVQGPDSPALMERIGLPTDMDYMQFRHVDHAGAEITVCRTGYTGEVGFELVVPVSVAHAVWDELLADGARACGLGARDTLRTEMGYPLHGQDLSRDITPVQARTGWAVGWSKPAFHGRDALLAEKENGPARRTVGLVSLDRAIPRQHMAVQDASGATIGEVTSGTFSPTRKVGVALALVATSAGLKEGDEVLLDVRGRPARFVVTNPPFVETSVR